MKNTDRIVYFWVLIMKLDLNGGIVGIHLKGGEDSFSIWMINI